MATKNSSQQPIPSKSCEIALASGDYLLVPKPGVLKREDPAGNVSGDVKSTETEVKQSSHASVMGVRSSGRGSKPKSGGMIRVKLWQKIAQSQSTTGLGTASALQPSSADGFSTFGAVYDVARCNGVEVHVFALDGSATQSNGCWATSFDPSNTGTMTQVTTPLENKYHTGPHVLPNAGSSGMNPGIATRSGMQTFRARTAKDMFESSVSGDKVGGNWFPANTTSAIIGYLKPYVENPAAGTVYITHYVCYDMEFAFRG